MLLRLDPPDQFRPVSFTLAVGRPKDLDAVTDERRLILEAQAPNPRIEPARRFDLTLAGRAHRYQRLDTLQRRRQFRQRRTRDTRRSHQTGAPQGNQFQH